ncbi:MAG: gas vesicle protein [Bacteroidales bacterium]
MAQEQITHAINATGLADILERVLDKGIVIAGDIKIQIADIDLLTIKIRLLVCSVDKAMEMGINWWQEDTYLSTKAREKEMMQQQETLEARLQKLEAINKPL